MTNRQFATLLVISILASGSALADDLTRIIQQDLVTLGYEPGNTDGEATTQTIVAISKFQAEHSLEVTGEASPQLAGVIKAAIKQQNEPAAGATVAATAPAPATDPAALQAAQQACLQQKIAAAQEANKKKRGLGSLVRAIGRTAGRFGGSELARDISQTTYDIYNVNATAADLESAAKDLGLTTDDLEACRNPAM
jgi:peptidoglycan hydrolase-like protein with peptidoglycan-binding domain